MLLFPYLIIATLTLIVDIFSGRGWIGFLLFIGQLLAPLAGMLLKFYFFKTSQLLPTIEIIIQHRKDLRQTLISIVIIIGISYWLISLSLAFPWAIGIILIGFICGYISV